MSENIVKVKPVNSEFGKCENCRAVEVMKNMSVSNLRGTNCNECGHSGIIKVEAFKCTSCNTQFSNSSDAKHCC